MRAPQMFASLEFLRKSTISAGLENRVRDRAANALHDDNIGIGETRECCEVLLPWGHRSEGNNWMGS